jgi:hypothetical protein
VNKIIFKKIGDRGPFELTKPLKTAATVGQQDIIEKKSSAPSLFLFIPLKLSQAIQKKR